jgi:hypothetical protein
MLIAEEIGIVDPAERHGHRPEVLVRVVAVPVPHDDRQGGREGVRANREGGGLVLTLEVLLVEGDDRPAMKEITAGGVAPPGQGPMIATAVHDPRIALGETAAAVVVFVTTITTTAKAPTITMVVVAIVDITTTTRKTKRRIGWRMIWHRFSKLLTTSKAQTAPHRHQLLAPLRKSAGEIRTVPMTRINVDNITTIIVGLEVEVENEAAGEGVAMMATMTTTTTAIVKTMTFSLPQADGIKADTTIIIGLANVVRNANATNRSGRRNEIVTTANHRTRRNGGVLPRKRSAGAILLSITSTND